MPAIPTHDLRRNDTTLSAAYLAQNNGPIILAITGFWCATALIVVSLRMYVRGWVVRNMGWDDYAILVTAALGTAIYICFVGEVHWALGRHYQAITTTKREHFERWQFFHGICSLFAIMTVKFAVSLLLLRLVANKRYRIFLYSLMGFMAVYTVVCAGTLIASCIPISANWNDAEAATAKCISTATWDGLGISNSVFSMLTDGLLAVLPIPLIFKMQLNRRTKLALSFVLSLGFGAVVCGGIKTHYQWLYFETPDRLYADNYFVWAALEVYSGIIAASLPTLKPILSSILDTSKTAMAVSRTFVRTHIHGTLRADRSQIPPRKDSMMKSKAGIGLDSIQSPISTPGTAKCRDEGFFGKLVNNHSCEMMTECSRARSFDSMRDGTIVASPNPSDNIVVTTRVTYTSEQRIRRESSTPSFYLCPKLPGEVRKNQNAPRISGGILRSQLSSGSMSPTLTEKWDEERSVDGKV